MRTFRPRYVYLIEIIVYSKSLIVSACEFTIDDQKELVYTLDFKKILKKYVQNI